MGEKAPTPCDLAQLKTAIGLLILDLEIGQKGRNLTGGRTENTRELTCAHRITRNQQQRLKGALDGASFNLAQVLH